MDLNQLKNKFFEDAKTSKGTKCPCCGRYAKFYKRSINAGMVKTLIFVYKWHLTHGFENYCNLMKIYFDNDRLTVTDFTKFAYWGIVERSNELRQDKSKDNGKWRITAKGIQFVKNQISVPKYVILYNNTVYGFEGDPIYIHECSGKFDYSELMSMGIKTDKEGQLVMF